MIEDVNWNVNQHIPSDQQPWNSHTTRYVLSAVITSISSIPLLWLPAKRRNVGETFDILAMANRSVSTSEPGTRSSRASESSSDGRLYKRRPGGIRPHNPESPTDFPRTNPHDMVMYSILQLHLDGLTDYRSSYTIFESNSRVYSTRLPR